MNFKSWLLEHVPWFENSGPIEKHQSIVVVKDQGITEFSQVYKIKFSKINSVRQKGKKDWHWTDLKKYTLGQFWKAPVL